MVLPNGRNGFYQRKNRSSTSRQRKYKNLAGLSQHSFDDEPDVLFLKNKQVMMQGSILLIQPMLVNSVFFFFFLFNF